MKILILSNFGMGLYKFRMELVQELINQQHKVYVSFPNDEYVSILEQEGCVYIESEVDRRGTNPIADFKLIFSYLKMISKVKPDIVLTYTIKPNIFGGIACRITNTRYIPNITGLGTALETDGILQKITLFLYRIGLRSASNVFFQNESNRNFFLYKSLIKSNSEVIPGSGVNLEQHCYEEYPNDSGNIQLLFIGRIMKSKGVDELFEVAKFFKEQNSRIEFNIVGFCEEEYQDTLKTLNADGVIKFHGQQNDVHKFIKDCYAIILPSYHEGISNVLLEAASTGRPILATNVPGCKETFKEGISGFSFEARSTSSMINTIQMFLSLPNEARRQMGIEGRRKMENEYDRKIVVKKYLDII